MKEVLIIVGPLVASLGLLPYLKQTLQGKIKPRISSWGTWTLIVSIATIAAIAGHAYASAALTGLQALVTGAIFFASLKNGIHEYGRLDALCNITSAVGIVAWLTTNNPAWAIVFNILADFFAAVPTYLHAWTKPHEEGWQGFFFVSVGAFISLLAVSRFNFINVAFPLYLTLLAGSIATTIKTRQRVVAVKK